MSHATKARVSRESHAYTFSLQGYDKAVAWVKSCIVRNKALEAMKPDARVRAEGDEDNDAAGVEIRKTRPAEAPKLAPTLPADVIEVQAREPLRSPQKPAAVAPAATPLISADAAKPAEATAAHPVARLLAAVTTSLASDAARASPNPIAPETPVDAAHTGLAPVAGAETPAQRLLPRLIAAANRSDFSSLDKSAAPAPLQRADVVFRLTGVTGGVIATDLPTAEAATNEALAYDRIACGGAYTATTSGGEDSHADVIRATSQCNTGDTALSAHYLTLSRKTGGFFIVGLTSEATTSGETDALAQLTATDAAFFDAALKLTGKF
jgi:hypothetical protein